MNNFTLIYYDEHADAFSNSTKVYREDLLGANKGDAKWYILQVICIQDIAG